MDDAIEHDIGGPVLRWIRIRNVAVIDRLEVDFEPGLNLLTGETGAGKSILIDALGLVLGSRASSDLLRSGAETAIVEAGFELSPMPRSLARRLTPIGIEVEEEIVVRRELNASGRGKVTVNGVAATAQLLRDMASHLADIHGQGESSSLLKPDAGLDILDRFGETRDRRRAVRDALRETRRIEQDIASVETRAREREKRKRELAEALDEIEKAGPSAGEDEDLLAERRLVGHAEKLKMLSEEVFRMLYEDEDSAISRLGAAWKRVSELASIDPRWLSYLGDKESLMSPLQDLALHARDYARSIDVTPGRLDELESRLAQLERLKKKYGGTLAEVLALRERAKKGISELEGSEEKISELRGLLEAACSRYRTLAKELSARRRQSAKRLVKLVAAELKDLALEKARFRVELSSADGADSSCWRESGLDLAELLFSANPGEEPRPLAKAASGGELSRFVLGLKAVSAKGESPRTLVFDEVDSGIGGRVADAVGKKLSELARVHQVICVTHLPQIASFAPAHYRIDKMEREGRTETRIARLDPESRVDEIARMLAGSVVTESAREHARQLVRDKN
jgi:DNA repair protein RecN (Recombination protein N)